MQLSISLQSIWNVLCQKHCAVAHINPDRPRWHFFRPLVWGWFYLSTVLDDFSRYIIACKLCTTMKAEDVTDTLTMALQTSGCDSAKVVQRPRPLSDNGPSYVSSDLAAWLSDKGMEHTRGAPCHPQTQGKIERWHQTLKNRILLENYSCRVISSSRSRRSSITTTTAATTRASTISPLPTSTSGAAISSRWKGKGSKAKPSNSAACFIEMQRPNVTNLMDQSLR